MITYAVKDQACTCYDESELFSEIEHVSIEIFYLHNAVVDAAI